jgi:hypothetical protein
VLGDVFQEQDAAADAREVHSVPSSDTSIARLPPQTVPDTPARVAGGPALATVCVGPARQRQKSSRVKATGSAAPKSPANIGPA